MRLIMLPSLALLSMTVVFGAPRAWAQSLAGTWAITNTAQNACPGQLQISAADTRFSSYTGTGTFQCGGDPAVTEKFDIAMAHGIVTMDGHDASGPWCADHYTLNMQDANSMAGSSKDGCGVTGSVSLAKMR